MTSGPCTSAGLSPPSPLGKGGMATDLVSPLTSVSTSIGCIVAPSEIFPTSAPASDGRPRALANSFETCRFPPVMLSKRALAS